MTHLGFLGGGLMSTEIATLAVAAGLDVQLSNSRGPQTLTGVVAGLGPRAEAVDAATAAQADVVVLSLPMGRLPELDPALVTDRTVLDLTNYYPHRDGRIPEIDDHEVTAGQYVQQHLPKARVVRAFNNICFHHIPQLARPAGAADRTALPLAGDDPAAKSEIGELVDLLGFDTLDAGDLAASWRFEPNTAAYLLCYAPAGTAFEQLMDTAGAPAGAAAIREVLAGVSRTDQGARTF